MTEKEIREAKAFLANPANAYNCIVCLFNNAFDDFQHRKPCGQWKCWVEAHCSQEEW